MLISTHIAHATLNGILRAYFAWTTYFALHLHAGSVVTVRSHVLCISSTSRLIGLALLFLIYFYTRSGSLLIYLSKKSIRALRLLHFLVLHRLLLELVI